MGQHFDHHDERFHRFGFLDSLEQADSEREVVAIVRDYLARIGPAEIATLPEDCWPTKITDREDVGEYALRIARRRALSPQSVSNDALLERLHSLLSHAAARSALLAGRGAKPPDASLLDEAVGRKEDDL